MEYKEMTDYELCKLHSHNWGISMTCACAEGSQYFKERETGIKAERICDEIEREFVKRGIYYGWKRVDNASRHGYTKNGEDIAVF